jgi:hypothetical protein
LKRKLLVICHNCRFPNMPGASVCLTCKQPLPEDAEEASADSFDSDMADLEGETQTFPRPRARPDETRMHVTRKKDEPTSKVQKIGTPRAPTRSEAEGRVWRAWDDAPTVAWLHCEPLPPIPLGPKRVVTMGRGADCDLVLPHSTVSRVHAQIRMLGRQLVLEDKSRFGTFLNSRQVSSAQIELGDRLTIGPYEIKILSPEAGSSHEPHGEETRPLDLSPFRKGLENAELIGSLERISLAEILQGFEFNGKTGTLKVTATDHEGFLVVREGQPLFAVLGEQRDDDAVLTMLDFKEGSFAFWSEEQQGERTMTCKLTHLLLEHSRRQDERSLGE